MPLDYVPSLFTTSTSSRRPYLVPMLHQYHKPRHNINPTHASFGIVHQFSTASPCQDQHWAGIYQRALEQTESCHNSGLPSIVRVRDFTLSYSWIAAGAFQFIPGTPFFQDITDVCSRRSKPHLPGGLLSTCKQPGEHMQRWLPPCRPVWHMRSQSPRSWCRTWLMGNGSWCCWPHRSAPCHQVGSPLCWYGIVGEC